MANSFVKQETIAFETVFEKFQDGLIFSNLYNTYKLDDTLAERSSNTIWRTMPYIAQSFTGIDQSSNFNRNYTQLSVPTTLGFSHAVPLTLSATELRDKLQEGRLGEAAMQRLASDINVDCQNLCALTGTIFVKQTATASGFDDVALCDDAMNRNGIEMMDRKLVLSSFNYNKMASNLAQRTLDNPKSLSAYERAQVGQVAGFDTYKADYAYSLSAAAGVGVTMTGANQFYTPAAMSTAGTGQTSPVDNRYQTISITVTAGTVKVGDAFTIAGITEVHHITKLTTGILKTFRITAIVTGAGGTGTVQISPPIITGQGGTDAELQYKNCTGTLSAGANIVFLNTVTAHVNPFWQADAFEIMPGRYMPDPNSSLPSMTATTDQGITVQMTRQGAIGDLSTKYRWDVFYGLVNKQPEMTGLIMFGQT